MSFYSPGEVEIPTILLQRPFSPPAPFVTPISPSTSPISPLESIDLYLTPPHVHPPKGFKFFIEGYVTISVFALENRYLLVD